MYARAMYLGFSGPFMAWMNVEESIWRHKAMEIVTILKPVVSKRQVQGQKGYKVKATIPFAKEIITVSFLCDHSKG